MNRLEQYISDLIDVKFWFNANLYNGDGVALPADGSVINGTTNLPKDLKSGTNMDFISNPVNTAMFKTSPNRIELISTNGGITGDYGRVSVFKNLDVAVQNTQWIIWVVASFIDTSVNRNSLFELNSSAWTLGRENNSNSILPGFLPIPVLQGTANNSAPVVGGTLASPEIQVRSLMTTPTVYKIICNGIILKGVTNRVENRSFNNPPAFILNSIRFGKYDSVSGKTPYANIYECIYINNNNIASEKQIDSYLHQKYNI